MPDDVLSAGEVLSSALVSLEAGEHDPADVVSGSPSTGLRVLHDYRGVEVGVWEMTEGAMTDVEADEVFVVLSGRATVDIAADESAAGGSLSARRLEIGPGDLVRLEAGMRTTWTVHEVLRKLYVAPS